MTDREIVREMAKIAGVSLEKSGNETRHNVEWLVKLGHTTLAFFTQHKGDREPTMENYAPIEAFLPAYLVSKDEALDVVMKQPDAIVTATVIELGKVIADEDDAKTVAQVAKLNNENAVASAIAAFMLASAKQISVGLIKAKGRWRE